MSDWRAARPAWLERLLASLPLRLSGVRVGRASLRGRAVVLPLARAEVELAVGAARVTLEARGEIVFDARGVRGEIVAERGLLRFVLSPRVSVRGAIAGTTLDATGVVSGQPLALHARLDGTVRRPRYRGVLRVEGAALPIEGALAGPDPRVVLRLEGRPAWLARVLARRGVAASFDDASLHGELAVDARGVVRGEATFEATAATVERDGARAEARALHVGVELSGSAKEPDAVVKVRAARLDARSLVLSSASATIAVRGAAAFVPVVVESDAVAYGGRVSAKGPVDRLEVALDGVGLAALDALAEASGGPPPPRLPFDVRATGVLARTDGGFGGRLGLDVAASRLSLDLRLDAAGALDGSVLSGSLSLADVAPDAARGSLVVDARLAGTALAPSARGRVSSPRVTLLGAAPLFFEDLAAEIDVSPERLSWRSLTARLYGGRLDSHGALGLVDGAARARVRLRDVRVERLGRDVEREVSGALGLDVEAEWSAKGALVARGEAALADAEYRFLRATKEDLARFGLPPLPTRGAGPAQARLRYEGGVLYVDGLLARVRGVDLSGALRIDAHGALRGAFEAHALEEYLRRSAVLSVPAVLAGKVTVPVIVRGTLTAPRVEADLLGALGALLASNRLRDAVGSLLGPMGARARRRRRD